MLHVVIVNYQSADYTIECVRSFGSEKANFYVLDNGSPDPTEFDTLESNLGTRDGLKLLQSGENTGFGAGVNSAVSSISAEPDDLLWILNPDTTVTSSAIDEMTRYVGSTNGVIASPVIHTGDNSDSVWFAGGRLDRSLGESSHFTRIPPASDGTPYAVSFLTGAALMMKMSTWQSLGGFREDLFLYWEDADLSRRAVNAGIELRVVPSARIWHRVGASSSVEAVKSLDWYYYLLRNRLIVCADGPSDLPRLVLGVGIVPISNHILRAIKERGPFLPRLRAMIRGTRDGISIVRGRAEGGVRNESVATNR